MEAVLRVILAIAFFLLVTPVAMLLRLAGVDILGLRRNRATKSYFVDIKPTERERADGGVVVPQVRAADHKL